MLDSPLLQRVRTGAGLNNPYTGVLGVFVNRARLGQTLDVYEDGNILRDFVHVDDVAGAIESALDRPGAIVANVGSGTAISIMEWRRLSSPPAPHAPRGTSPAKRARATCEADWLTSGLREGCWIGSLRSDSRTV